MQKLTIKKFYRNYLIEYESYVAILLFLIVGFGLYVNSFSNQMFWDDNDIILNNNYVKNWKYIGRYFSENLISGAGLLSDYWRPMLLLTFSVEWHLFKDWAPGYHFVNTSFHIIDATLLFFILLLIFKSYWLAVLTALVFLVHPLQTEAVTYVSGLGDSLSVFFMFSGILFYLKSRIFQKTLLKNTSYLLAVLMYVLALMSKETAIVMPAFIFIVDFYFLAQNEELSFKDKLKKIGKTIWFFFVLAGAYILLRATVLNFKNTFNLYNEENIFTSNFYVRLFTFFRVLTVYFRLLFWPFNLHMERTVEIATSLNSFSVIFGGLLFLSLLTLAFVQFRQFSVFSFGILWFFIGLAPTSNLVVPISGLLYEHWLYLPLVGIFLSLIWIGLEIGKRYSLKKTFLSIFFVYLIFFSVLTVKQNTIWKDPITFYTYTLKYAPQSYRVINNLGMTYDDLGNYKQAEMLYKRAINLDPFNPVAYHNLGNAYRHMNKKDLAIENYHTAIKLDPGFTFSYNALVSIYLEKKDYKSAREILEKYLDYAGLNADILILLAKIAVKQEDFNSALNYLNKALIIEPENQFVKDFIIDVKKLIEIK